MPHLYVEYTDNLAGLPGQQLLTELNAFVCGHPSILDEADVKARLLPVSQFEIGSAPANRGFVHVQLRLLAGPPRTPPKQPAPSLTAAPPPRPHLADLNALVCGPPSILDGADVKARLLPVSQFEIGSAPANRGFVHVQLRLLAGRTDTAKKELSEGIAAVLRRGNAFGQFLFGRVGT